MTAPLPSRWCAPWHHAAALPRALWLPGITCSEGTPALRLQHLRVWLDALDAGRLPPPEADFGAPDATDALRGVAGELELPALARGIPAIGEQVLRTLLWHLDRIADLQGPGGPAATRAEAIALTTADFRAAWQQQRVTLEPELRWLRQWADTGALRWDQLQGQLHRREWQAARRAAQRLQQLPELVALLRRLGRREAAAEPPRAATPRAEGGSARVPLAPVHTVLPGAPGEITGIRFSARIEQMLAAEAVALRHPVLRRLWRARQAEGRLLAHDTAAEVIDWRPDPTAMAHAPRQAPQREPLQRGPIVLCLDTSGSMRGAPEQIAKAVAIAALQVARDQRRGCRLIAFGGPGEVIERDLHDDLAAVLDLMGQAFDGGTDLQTPIERAVAAIDGGEGEGAGWHGADLLIVSDGEFGCRRTTLEALDAARARHGLFVQGVLVGDRETMGLLEVCDHIHWVRDWRRFAEGDAASGYSPVHSKSLTALYFPGALSAQAARHGRR
jgi:uncharacterized protein with von Willebrand factor type A (vWA) domain